MGKHAVDQIDVLLVDDDEEDYLLTKDLLSRLDRVRHEIHWVSDFGSALRAAQEGDYDVCLVDYRLGAQDGIELIRALVAAGHDVPVIVLTGQGNRDVDIEAARAGAADYLVKGEVSPALLERTIRYAMQSHTDMRALRESEEGLRQAHKMEAVGNLAGGIAHDFNNLLTVIKGYVSILNNRLTDDELSRHATAIAEAADRAAELTQQLLAFSRQQVLRPEPTVVNDVVGETLRLLDRVIGEDIEVEYDLAFDLEPILVDRGQLGQVILNLAINARDAMPGGGHLSVKTANVELDGAYAAEHADVVAGRHVLLQVTDSGLGMDEQTRERVFDPFFTTKEEGTGLGLATVYGIVKQSGGHIWLYSELGTGTTFKIYFPLTGELPRIVPPSRAEVTSLEGTETILVVEDDPAVRGLVALTLESHGYTVFEAASPDEALAIVQGPTDFDLLLTDVVMPGMNGRELAEALLAERPALKVLFTSGYPADTIIRHGIAEASTAYLEKPYLPIELARKLREVLDTVQ